MTMKTIELEITDANAGQRIDVQTAELSGLTRSQVRRFIEKGLLKVNLSLTKPNYKTKCGDIIHIIIPEELSALVPENLPLEILYMDDYVTVVNKPSGMVVYPAAGHRGGTLMNAIAYYSKNLASIGRPLRPGIVHRLDKDTTGVMIVALDDGAYYGLIEQFKKKTVKRKYKALIYGSPRADSGQISLSIGRSVSDGKKMSTKVRRGKEAVTNWKVIERLGKATLVEAHLKTGRTHQIRVHFASRGHPVLGDKTYGRKTSLTVNKKKIVFPRQMLHAEMLGFLHPVNRKYMEFMSDIPDDMRSKLVDLRNT
jgi:23S rRNA pseudouridine1911/1915/1917 synthase